MSYSIQHIATILEVNSSIENNVLIEDLITDSRKIANPNNSLFFALVTQRNDGHNYIEEAYNKGVKCFVISKVIDNTIYTNATFIVVPNTLEALQILVSYKRKQYKYPVIGITGSNGKTIVKEWLAQLLQPQFKIVKNPRSYNSQIGVPLSVWQMDAQYTLGIFEAGISTTNEMVALANIIQPTIGVFTSFGDAHKEGFINDVEKLKEKLLLFRNCKIVVYNKDCIENILDLEANKNTLLNPLIQLFSWSRKAIATLQIITEKITNNSTFIGAVYNNEAVQFTIPFTDKASIDNTITCIATLLQFKYTIEQINIAIASLKPIAMRLQLKKGINNCYVLDDSYSNDLSSFSIAIDYLVQQAGTESKTVILSDFFQTGLNADMLYTKVANELQHKHTNRLIGIGKEISEYKDIFTGIIPIVEFYTTTEDFFSHSLQSQFGNEYILLKGARLFSFEKISHWLEQKVHQTVLEVNLTAMVHNLKQYQKQLQPNTKLMAMVKAYSYGSGSVEVARVLQYYAVDYLAVAYADEGVELRKGNIQLPIMVMNVDEAAFDVLVQNKLEPEIYSTSIYTLFHQYLLNKNITQYPIHLKINTGMNRLGFDVSEIPSFIEDFVLQNTMKITSVFSHLVASENAEHDAFTNHQATLFNEACSIIKSKVGNSFLQHLSNSSGIFRHPQMQYSMVRLGIGLYGLDTANAKRLNLQTVATLKTTIAQIRNIKANTTVGYNRNGVVKKDSVIATIRIGYGDGLSRKLGNGIGNVSIHEKLAPIIGNICMDMTMVDITHIHNAKEGDEVEIFGTQISTQQVATWAETITYEIMTNINQRVKRIYVEE